MSRLTDLMRQLRATDPQLSADLEKEITALTQRRSFGLVFERHQPEAVELPGQKIRRGSKVRILPARGETAKGDQRLWAVESLSKTETGKTATLLEITNGEPEEATADVADLVVVAEFEDKIYPGLVETGRVANGGDKPFHTVINAENFHALEMLTYTHRGKIDAIYIDPPYNTGARDWKYNNDYVEGDDDYRHSKWLAFMERRLLVAKDLLNPDDSVLIVTIDEKEYLRLGMLLEQTFPGADIQMIASVINPSGSSRTGRFSRTDEYIFFVMFGSSFVKPSNSDMLREVKADAIPQVRWNGLIRNGEGSLRTRIPSMFWPIHLDKEDGTYHSVGAPLNIDLHPDDYTPPDGTVAVWPIDGYGRELMWRLSPQTFTDYLAKGYVRFSKRDVTTGLRSPQYLQSGMVAKVESGDIEVLGRNPEGDLKLRYREGAKTYAPMTTWNKVSHSAAEHGAWFVKACLPGRKFPYPKSLYAVEDALRFFIKEKPEAVVLDFFSGSGTTAHAVMRLNKQDGGRRRSIAITNNEVGADEQVKLRKQGLRPGDPDWDKWGICDYITKPRIKAAITGLTPDGDPIKGDYKFTDEFPMADGFEENAAFFTLTYETPFSVRHNRAFSRIAPMLWMRAGSTGRLIDDLGDDGWNVSEVYAVLENTDNADEFLSAMRQTDTVKTVFVITENASAFQMICRELPSEVHTVQLYESYLQNFEINQSRGF
ncbi:site-specific DNA-methyltransferase [Leucobacter sp. VD1]|uniref:site-specific DNA-methyltransferase n=1 Tax=Leucobacter sp. VD1 TaxID=3080381 RepID=UPI0030163135